ncbi:MAG: class I SAM-dependent methyltransferase [Saprospiraceae bacterium]|nr:class I SAM-dependent methyltransferase [Saprospiraceae bacterium]
MSALGRYLSYYSKAVNAYQVHSPAIYNFITKVLDQEKAYYKYEEIEHLRELYLKSKDSIPFIELGAGSKKLSGNTRRIAQIAKTSLSPVKTCRILFNAVKCYNCKNVLELGSSLGISTAYLAAVNNDTKVISLEGNPASADIARHNAKQLELPNIEIVTGIFEETLTPTLGRMKQVDLAYLDGNHSYDATIEYFDKILPYLNENSVIVLDDIYWSDGMLNAWKQLIQHTAVTYSIDIYSSGFLFFNKSMKSKQHFALIENWKKIWQVGLFSKIKK